MTILQWHGCRLRSRGFTKVTSSHSGSDKHDGPSKPFVAQATAGVRPSTTPWLLHRRHSMLT